MNRILDERLELQLQEYEFAELLQPLPAYLPIHAMHEAEDFQSAMEAIVNRH